MISHYPHSPPWNPLGDSSLGGTQRLSSSLSIVSSTPDLPRAGCMREPNLTPPPSGHVLFTVPMSPGTHWDKAHGPVHRPRFIKATPAGRGTLASSLQSDGQAIGATNLFKGRALRLLPRPLISDCPPPTCCSIKSHKKGHALALALCRD